MLSKRSISSLKHRKDKPRVVQIREGSGQLHRTLKIQALKIVTQNTVLIRKGIIFEREWRLRFVTSMMKTTDAKYQLQFDTFMSQTSFIYKTL